MRLRDVAADLSARLVSIWLPDAEGHRPVAGAIAKFRDDPEWHDLLLFHEYFHGETGAGIGASHQTGWTGLVAHLLCRGGPLDRSPDDVAGARDVAAGSATAARRLDDPATSRRRVGARPSSGPVLASLIVVAAVANSTCRSRTSPRQIGAAFDSARSSSTSRGRLLAGAGLPALPLGAGRPPRPEADADAGHRA
jgi:hypothetical protein